MEVTVVQKTSSRITGAGSANNALAFASNNTTGNMLVVAVSCGASNTLLAPTDTQGNNYQLAVTKSAGGAFSTAAIYYVSSCKGGANTVISHLGVDGNNHLHIYEISGVNYVDAFGSIIQTGTALTVTAGTADTNAAEYVFGFFASNNGQASMTVGAGYGDTQSQLTGDTSFSEDKTVAAIGTQTATATAAGSDTFVNLIATFSAIPGSGSWLQAFRNQWNKRGQRG